MSILPKKLFKMSKPGEGWFWAEINGDSGLDSLTFRTLGWLPAKRDRVERVATSHALVVVLAGSGSFRRTGERKAEPVQTPGWFLISPDLRCDYGPGEGETWEELYWNLHGPRREEWERAGWWRTNAGYQPLTATAAGEALEIFQVTAQALETHNRAVLDANKLRLEQWLCARSTQASAVDSSLERLIQRWRQQPEQPWSMPQAAADLGLSYTGFRRDFLRQFGRSPYDYLLRLRLELAANWLRGTHEPIKAIARRCGFVRPESFVRAFGQRYGKTPARWRKGG